jgi:acyl-CoA dehydrogenase
MDVVAGRGVITGPRNFLARAYQAVPIAITVEGANILTRSLMVFGQGAIRCHPFITEEIAAAQDEDEKAGLERFDAVFYHHICAHGTQRPARAAAVLRGGGSSTCPSTAPSKHYRQLARFSAAFALLTDATLLAIGGGLKARQRLSGRMADALVQLYYGTAVIKFWHDAGLSRGTAAAGGVVPATKPLRARRWRCADAIDNFPVAILRRPLRWLVFPPGTRRLPAGTTISGAPWPCRSSMTRRCVTCWRRGCLSQRSPDDPLGRVLNAYRLARETQPLRDRLHAAIRERDEDDLDGIALLMGHQRAELVDWAGSEGVVGEGEREPCSKRCTALYDVLRVDAFEADGIRELSVAAKGKRRVVERQRFLEVPEAPGPQLAAERTGEPEESAT